MFVFQLDLGERCPSGALRKEELCAMIGDNPMLAKSNRARDRGASSRRNAARAERISGLILRTIGNFVIERAELLGAMPIRVIKKIIYGKSEYFDEWMSSMFGHESASVAGE